GVENLENRQVVDDPLQGAEVESGSSGGLLSADHLINAAMHHRVPEAIHLADLVEHLARFRAAIVHVTAQQDGRVHRDLVAALRRQDRFKNLEVVEQLIHGNSLLGECRVYESGPPATKRVIELVLDHFDRTDVGHEDVRQESFDMPEIETHLVP